MATADTIPLYPRRPLLGSPVGGSRSVRRGDGSEVRSSRPYRPGDHVHSIDWKSSARLSSAGGSDAFIVRERYSEETPRVVIAVDRRPEMALYPPDFPWLRKPAALTAAAGLIVESARAYRSLVGYLDYASHDGEGDAGSPFWRPPRTQASVWDHGLSERVQEYLGGSFDAPDDTVERALEFLSATRGAIPIGSFVFVLSDFSFPAAPSVWAHTGDRGWDIVPVIIQDPLWEQSFPAVDSVVLPVADVHGGRRRYIRLTAREATERRRRNEERLAALQAAFQELGLDSILIGSSDHAAIFAAFLGWAEERFELRGVHR